MKDKENIQYPTSKEGQKERPTFNIEHPIMNEKHCREQERAVLVLFLLGRCPRLYYFALLGLFNCFAIVLSL